MSGFEQIPSGSTLLIDTNPLIYLLENNPLVQPFAPLFTDIDSGRLQAVVTPITLAEVVGGPLAAGKDALAERYRATLTSGAGWRLVDIDDDIAVMAARFRIRYGLRLPDALQVGAAIRSGCFGIVTHDRDFHRVDEVPVFGV